ncbi:TetR/AcrR family transcriptional regulator [Sphingomonas sp. KR1UV-12]|uniref:TetR/AcrR family transcriptional regulator n=1 Tax=Sphingomonas aurea TaxID=3063994 RepID=A0ABT9EJM6_9SPHN|nr:TetR/AcrR family transcriptional regulator [Sphingomonas sp. KR1UV-12]MDP1026843.1 TetR/AcrR family transcriptional regulator [Sphingomonas sp. KR1UV-12]
MDGRSARVVDGRRRVAAAIFELVSETGALPSAAVLAKRAGVGRATVFRYFDGVQSLELELARMLRASMLDRHPFPTSQGDRRARLHAFVEHRAAVYELVTPVRCFIDAARARGNPDLDELMAEAAFLLRQNIATMFGPDCDGSPEMLRHLEVISSWEAWRSMRDGQMLSVSGAKRDLSALLSLLLPGPAASTDAVAADR